MEDTAKTGPGKHPRIHPMLLIVIYGNMALYGFIISMRGISLPLIKNSYGASYSEQGLMTAVISFTAVSVCILAGIFMNRLGLKKTAVTGFILMITGMFLIRFAGSFWMAAGIYLVMQGGFSFFEIGLNGMGVRIFTANSAMMINLLHFFFGLGSIGGPRFAGFIVNKFGLQWQMIYPLAIIPALMFFAVTALTHFPGKINEAAEGTAVSGKNRRSFAPALRDPFVWIFGIIMGLSGSVEACMVSWSGLFLSDVYGMNIETEGALFVSVFFMLYTFSRLAAGFYIEKAGYIRVTVIAGTAALALYTASFMLGRNGIVLLPVTGIFTSLIYPTMLAVSVGVFREKAQDYSSAIIVIAFILNGFVQLGFGLSNRILGPSWAFKSCVPYSAAIVILLFVLGKMVKQRESAAGK